jgi:prevent-host-death family protein
MTKLRVDEDIRPLSDFRAGIASFVKQINETNRPMILTQRGRGVAVLVGVHEYQRMQERLELLEDIYRADAQIEAGEGVSHTEAKGQLLRQLRQL